VLLAASITNAQETTSPDWPERHYAPYAFAGALPLAATAKSTGILYYTLAFMLAGDSCRAAWNGSALLKNMPYLQADIEQLRALGGDVLISFGGWGGNELAQVCADAASLTEQYQSVIDTYQVTHLDFDIEGDEIHDPDSIERRSRALAALQDRAAGSGGAIHISFTLPVLPTGLTEEGLAVLQSALDNGVEIEVVNIMTMNFGESFPPDKMGENTIQAAESLFEQLQELYPHKGGAELWGMIGLTPMIGLNDSHPEVFTLEDAEAVTTFARANGIRRIAMWSLGRDKECVSEQKIVSDRCSGVLQEPFAYSVIFNQVIGDAR
jgi:hypothetical protein